MVATTRLWLFFAATAVLLLVCASGFDAEPSTALAAQAKQGRGGVEWLEDYDAAREQAAEQFRSLLVFIYEDRNRDHEQYFRRTLNHRNVTSLLEEHFVAVRLEKDTDAAKAFTREHSLERFPVTLLLTPAARPRTVMQGTVRRPILVDRMEAAVAAMGGGVAPRNGDAAQPPPPPPDPQPDRPGATVTNPHKPAQTFAEASERTRRMERGLNWLTTQQLRDGSFRRPPEYADRNRQHSRDFTRTALTSLAALAFCVHDPQRHERHIQRATTWLMRHTHDDGLIADEAEHSLLRQAYTFWQMPLAMWLIAERLHTEPEGRDADAWRNALAEAAALLVAQQGEDGGWGYGLNFSERDSNTEWGFTQIGPSGLCTAVLGIIRDLEIAVDGLDEAIQRGVTHLVECQQRDGGCRYRHGDRMRSYPEATAFAVLGLGLTGHADSPQYARMAAYLKEHASEFGLGLRRYHATGRVALGLAFALLDVRKPTHAERAPEAPSDEGWAAFWDVTFRDYGFSTQDETNHYWPDADERGGRIWATASHLLALAAPSAARKLRTLQPPPPE